MDERNIPLPEAANDGGAAPQSAKQDAVVAFCQQCGRPLTYASRRQVGPAIVCESCAQTYTAQPGDPHGGWTSVPTPGSSGSDAPAAPGGLPPKRSEANPALGGFLGLIPGVGAMYNGQYAKAAIHLVIFVILVSLANDVNEVFGWFVAGWVFYQAFDAYHTARAQRDGDPLPDPFGWNGIGERFTGGRNWSSPSSPRTGAYTSYENRFGSESGTSHTGPFTAGQPRAQEPVPESHSTTFPSYAAASSSDPVTPPVFPGAVSSYTPTYTGAGDVPDFTASPPSNPERFPNAAAWLIGLGSLLLLSNVWPSWHLTGRWLPPLLLAGIALWSGTRRLQLVLGASAKVPAQATASATARAAAALLGPGLLLTCAILLALQAGNLVNLRRSWPALLIVWGTLLLVERSTPPPNRLSYDETGSAAAPPQESSF